MQTHPKPTFSRNEIFRTDRPQNTDPLAYYRDRASYYAADGTLRAADARYVSTGSIEATAFFTGVFEEYRYDALGRRIWVRARRLCEGDPMDFDAECRLSKVRRIVWDGDEELYEIQMPGQDGSPHLETDTNLPALPADNAGGSNLVDPNPFYGRVAYTHALGIDQPLGIVRMNYGDRLNDNGHDVGHRALDPFMISPIWNERGEPYLGTFEDGGVGKCQPPTGVGHDTVLRCVYIGYQAGWVAYMRPSFRPHHWHGSLTEDKKDAAGTNFRRNRYYDSEKGKFTQEDPIGLAGGINLYGFANGDPVNFSDPFGLCPEDKPICHWVKATLILAGTDLGGIAGGGAGLLAGPGALVASPIGAFAGMAAGAAIGGAVGEIVDWALFSKSSRDRKGTEFRGGKQSQRDPDHARLTKEFNPDRKQRTRIHDEIAKQKRGGDDLDYDTLRQIFLDIVGRPK